MDDDAGDEQESAPIGHWTTTSSHDVCMMDTPKRNDDEDQKGATRDRSLEKKSKRRRKRHAKPHLDRDPAIEQGEPADDEHAIEQPSEQGNLDKQTKQPVPGEDNIPDDLTPDKLLE